ncbi:MAG: hypothetical protein IK149_01675 [Oscillospiraceae bacterium]|nr:hypothetical protein [Oscillospiraceae bacterium]
MQIKQIAKLVKQSGELQLWTDAEQDTQWICNGYGAWPLYGFPFLDSDSVLAVLDIPEKDREKIIVTEKAPPDGICLKDEASEEELPDPPISICYGGELLLPLETSEGLLLVDPNLFKPLRDVQPLTVHVRKTKRGEAYLAAKGGMLLHGILWPRNLKTYGALPDLLGRIAGGLTESITRDAEKLPDEEDDQIELGEDDDDGA